MCLGIRDDNSVDWFPCRSSQWWFPQEDNVRWMIDPLHDDSFSDPPAYGYLRAVQVGDSFVGQNGIPTIGNSLCLNGPNKKMVNCQSGQANNFYSYSYGGSLFSDCTLTTSCPQNTGTFFGYSKAVIANVDGYLTAYEGSFGQTGSNTKYSGGGYFSLDTDPIPIYKDQYNSYDTPWSAPPPPAPVRKSPPPPPPARRHCGGSAAPSPCPPPARWARSSHRAA